MANIIFTKKSLSSSIEGDIKVNSKADAGTYSITTIDHDKLKNRDLPDQHPIDAITGLTDTIQEIRQENTNTNARIDELTTELNEDIAALEQADQDIIQRVEDIEDYTDTIKDNIIYDETNDKINITKDLELKNKNVEIETVIFTYEDDTTATLNILVVKD